MLNAQSWQFDAPTGTYKSHVLSQQVLEASIAKTLFMPYVEVIEKYGAKQGETVTIPRFSNAAVPSNARIGEFDDIPEDLVAQSTRQVTVAEWARSIPYTNFNAMLSPLDIEQYLRNALQKQLQLVLDKEAAAAFKTSLIKYIPTGAAAGTFDTDGTPSSPATSNMNFYHIERLRDYAAATLYMDTGMDGLYNLVAATLACRGIKLDPKFEVWHAPNNLESKLNGVIGKIEGVKVIECNNQGASGSSAALRNDLGTGGVLGECIFFGNRPVAMAVVQNPEIRVYKSSFDGRRYNISWHGIFEFTAKWAADSASAGEGDIIHVSSS